MNSYTTFRFYTTKKHTTNSEFLKTFELQKVADMDNNCTRKEIFCGNL